MYVANDIRKRLSDDYYKSWKNFTKIVLNIIVIYIQVLV